WQGKPETRNPKAERNPKPEIRILQALASSQGVTIIGNQKLAGQTPRLRRKAFGLRISALFRPSAFGFRVSHTASSSTMPTIIHRTGLFSLPTAFLAAAPSEEMMTRW